MLRTAALFMMLAPLSAFAVTLDMPSNAHQTVQKVTAVGSYALPTAPWSPDGMPVLTGTGEVQKQAWRIDASGLTTLQLLAPLQQQLLEDGFEILFTCTDAVCGGFDFRFATDVLPAPDMHVDFGDFRFVSARRADDTGTELVSLLVSRSSTAGFIQVIRVGPADDAPIVETAAPAARATSPAVAGDFAQELEETGRFILSDLAFETGSAQLGDAAFPSLQNLADYLIANPNRTIALVGHTDSIGSLAGNVALSKRRAGSVLERLASAFNVPRRQLEAEGVGYLTPIATNLTVEGREINRRVEVIITSTEQ